jgi:hypothetical protein
MNRLLLLFLLGASCASGQAWLAAPASYTCRIPYDGPPADFIQHTVRYVATNITICGMLATTGLVLTTSAGGEPTYVMFSDGEPITRGPDLAAGAWGWDTGAVFSGTVTVTTNTIYQVGTIPVGYAVVGTSSNPAVVTVGGANITVSNSFDRSIGPVSTGTQISMCTTGYANIGIVQMASNAWYGGTFVGSSGADTIDESSVNTNALFLSFTWTCTPTTNYTVARFSKYGILTFVTNAAPLSYTGHIAQNAQMRVCAVRMFSQLAQQWRFFGWRAIYGPTPTEAKLTQLEIDARAEYTARGWGQ